MTYPDKPRRNVETSPDPIIGYREWRWDPELRRLVGPHTGVAWDPAVAFEGRVCVHDCGLRGQRARIVALTYGLSQQRTALEESATLYGAETVAPSELRQTALRFGVEVSPPPGSEVELPPPEVPRRVALRHHCAAAHGAARHGARFNHAAIRARRWRD